MQLDKPVYAAVDPEGVHICPPGPVLKYPMKMK